MRAHLISDAGVELIKRFEGFRAEPLAIGEAGWVVGYGHVRFVAAGGAISQAEAEAQLRRDLAPVERFVNSVVTAPIGQPQYDALVSFCFSVGQTAFAESDVLRKVNAAQFVAAACAMDAWRKSSARGESEIFDVLIRRRAAEKAMFLRDAATGGAPSVLLRAEQDHAAAILAAPVSVADMAPVAARPVPQTAQRLVEILKSEPATTLVLTQVVAADDFGDEITTANARPVARKAAQRLGDSVATTGLAALLLFGLGLTGLGAAVMFGRADDARDVLGGFVLAGPGVLAAITAIYGLWRGPVQHAYA